MTVEGEMTVAFVTDFDRQMQEARAKDGALELDLSGVTEMDTAGLQAMFMAKRRAAAEGVQLTIVGHSQAVLHVLDLLNVGRELGDPLVITSKSVGGAS